MNIKVGDKVRIMTKEELLQNGYEFTRQVYFNKNVIVYKRQTGKIVKLLYPEQNSEYYSYQDIRSGKIGSIPLNAIAEVIPQTLDEYIYSLPLEERAKYFVDKDSGSGYYLWKNTITEICYCTYDEALRETIKALKQPKE